MEKNKDIANKSIRKNKWDYFFAFYRNSGFYTLWLVTYVVSIIVTSIFEFSVLIIEVGSIIVSAIVSLIIYGIIIIVSKNTYHPTTECNSSRGFISAQTMRMLKRNIRRRWL